MLLSALWGGYLLTLATGTFLLFQHAAYDPPLSGSEWSSLDEKPYALPYYNALYGKVLIFVLMGVATLVLATGGSRAARQSESAGGPRSRISTTTTTPRSAASASAATAKLIAVAQR